MENPSGTEEYFDLSFSEEPASYYYLLLTIDQEWVHAAWYHSTKNLITGFARYPNQNSLKGLIEQHPYLRSEFKEVIAGVQNETIWCTPSTFSTPPIQTYFSSPMHLMKITRV